MNVKLFLFKLFTVFLFIQLSLGLYVYFCGQRIFYDLYSIVQYHKHITNKPDLPILHIGNSQLMNATIAKSLKSSQLMIAPGGSTPEFYYLLKSYLKKNSSPKEVYLYVSPSQIFWGNTFWKVNLKYGFYEINELLELLILSWKKDLWIDFVGPILKFQSESSPSMITLKAILYQLNFFPYYQKEIQTSLFDDDKKKKNQIMLKNLKKTRGMFLLTGYESFSRTINTGLAEFRKRKNSTFKPSKLFEVYLEKIKDLTKEEKISIKIGVMPIRQKEGSYLNVNYFNDLNSYLRKKGFKTFELPDTLPNKYFFDALHLNSKGQAIVNKKIKEMLNDN